MYTEFVMVLIFSFFAEVFFQGKWIDKMHSLKIEQVVKLYGPSWHEKTKAGTPTMGGIIFIPVFLISIYAGSFLSPDVNFSLLAKIALYPLLAAAVGLLDDWLKYSRKSSDGLKSMEKLILQIIVTVPWAVWVTPDSLMLLPMISIPRYFGIALITFAGVGLQNAVNVTDGLDGLVAGSVLISLLGALSILGGEASVLISIGSAAGICIGFLWHNSNPASVFMGDVGSHFFAGLLLSLCVVSGVFLFIIPISFIFGLEMISVVVQIVSIRKFNKKIFLMSPVHHHFEMLGWKETHIVVRFWIIHALGMLLLIQLLFLLFFLV
ncbi:MAG: phospho-N-acetylmuramoyl-pentapeptide-transferase [Synergistaceae bacterium]|nr:phospho-N-acetylmuramoyl-pentapeptide-transferase [Synergistaceae bacterium]